MSYYSVTKKILHYTLIVIIGAITFSSYADSCDFLPPASQPIWTFDSPAIKGYYVGVGLAEEDDDGPDAQIEKARQQALADLASSIEVSVRSSLKIDIRERRSNGDADVDKDIQQLTETITDTSLKEVQVDSTWLDRKRCIVWVRVKVSRSIIKTKQHRELQARKLVLLDNLYDRAGDKTASASAKDNALDQAYIVFKEIDFKALKGVTSKAYYKRLLDNLGKKVRKSASSIQQAEKLRQQAEQLLLQANESSNGNTRKRKMAAAVGKLKQIIADNPVGESSVSFVSESAAFKIAEVEKARNNSCAAQFQYEIVRDRTQSDEWRNKAARLAVLTKCTRKNKKNRAWRKSFDGVRTTYLCASDIAGVTDDWGKPCESLQGFLSGFGAMDADYPDITSDQLVKLAYRLNKSLKAAAKLKDNGRVLIFVAKGKIKTRSNARNPMGSDYQFSGRIYSYVIHNGKLEFKDKYTGTGGWNPVSEEMAVEVLGLNVAKRWKKKYLQHIRNN
jgi:F0F1-type ATP synthase membrane subunit b/b'